MYSESLTAGLKNLMSARSLAETAPALGGHYEILGSCPRAKGGTTVRCNLGKGSWRLPARLVPDRSSPANASETQSAFSPNIVQAANLHPALYVEGTAGSCAVTLHGSWRVSTQGGRGIFEYELQVRQMDIGCSHAFWYSLTRSAQTTGIP